MGNPLARADFVRLLDTRLREVSEAKYNELPSKIPMLFNVMDSQSAWEEFYSVGSLPDIPAFNGKLSFLSIAPGFHIKIEHKEYAGAVQIERALIDDKKYGVLDRRSESLMESAHRTREKHGARAFTTAFSAAFDYQQNEEGIALCGTHLTKAQDVSSTGFDNAGSTAMSKTSIAAARLLMRGFRNDIGELIDVGDDLVIICPDALADTAYELVGTASGYETANSTKNMDYQRYEVIPWRRLDDDSTTNWFMGWKSQMKRDLAWLNRIMPEINTTVDFHTFQVLHSVYMRHSWGWKDWRWLYGMDV